MPQMDVQHRLDHARFDRFHALILFWCAVAIIFDGYDLAVVGIALPAIMKDMGITPTQAGFMASSALFGMMFGNVVFGRLADGLGRRLVICVCIAVFSLFTAAAGLMHDPLGFSLMRFLAGLGIGGVMPNVIAQMTDYAPLRLRSTLVTLMFSGYSVGGMLAALLGKSLIESHGWQAVFLAAAAPVLLLPWIWRQMPESPSYLLRRGQHEALGRILARLTPGRAPGMPHDGGLAMPAAGGPAPEADRAGFAALFAEGRARSTLLFWLTGFMCLFMVYALNSWLTQLLAAAGHSLGSALGFVLVLNGGATLGAIGGGWLADRWRIQRVLAGMCLLAALAIGLLGQGLPVSALFGVVALAGACTIGTQTVSCAYCSQFYPAACRATGLGLMLGVGRVGAMSAPIVIGVIMGLRLPLEWNFFAIALPALVAALAVLGIQHARSDLARGLAARSVRPGG